MSSSKVRIALLAPTSSYEASWTDWRWSLWCCGFGSDGSAWLRQIPPDGDLARGSSFLVESSAPTQVPNT